VANHAQVAQAAFQALIAQREEQSAKPLPIYINHHPAKPTPLQKLRQVAAMAAALKVQNTSSTNMGPQAVNPLADSPSMNPQGLLALLQQKQTDPEGLT
jgi:hypothetical protein